MHPYLVHSWPMKKARPSFLKWRFAHQLPALLFVHGFAAFLIIYCYTSSAMPPASNALVSTAMLIMVAVFWLASHNYYTRRILNNPKYK